MLTQVAEVIATGIAADGGSAVAGAVFGTSDAGAIAAALGEVCSGPAGAELVALVSYEASVGCVAVIDLDDGRRVVVKALPPRWTEGYLAAVHRVQRGLAGTGFPCPVPIAGPIPLLGGRALVDGHLPDPGRRRATPTVLAGSAAALAHQVFACAGLDGSDLLPHPLDAGGDGLYPTPHDPRFDFSAAAEGAVWIDELARAARSVLAEVDADLDAPPPVIAHGDWSMRNVRLDDQGRLLAAYDWDSLILVPEATAVGRAAATWSFLHGAEAAPSPGEVASYVRAYEAARTSVFSPSERRSVGAAALAGLAYAARCEHAVDPGRATFGRARSRLAVDGPALLSLVALLAGPA